MHADDCLIVRTRKKYIETFLWSMKNATSNDESCPFDDKGFEFTEKGDIKSFLGIKIERDGDFVKIFQSLLM